MIIAQLCFGYFCQNLNFCLATIILCKIGLAKAPLLFLDIHILSPDSGDKVCFPVLLFRAAKLVEDIRKALTLVDLLVSLVLVGLSPLFPCLFWHFFYGNRPDSVNSVSSLFPACLQLVSQMFWLLAAIPDFLIPLGVHHKPSEFASIMDTWKPFLV